jgi:hypothetical protein
MKYLGAIVILFFASLVVGQPSKDLLAFDAYMSDLINTHVVRVSIRSDFANNMRATSYGHRFYVRSDSLFRYFHLKKIVKYDKCLASSDRYEIHIKLFGRAEVPQQESMEYWQNLPSCINDVCSDNDETSVFTTLLIKASNYFECAPSDVEIRLVFDETNRDILFRMVDGQILMGASEEKVEQASVVDGVLLPTGVRDILLPNKKTGLLDIKIPPIDLNIKASAQNVAALNKILNWCIEEYYVKRLGKDVVERKGRNSILIKSVRNEITREEGVWTLLRMTFFFTTGANDQLRLETVIDGKWARSLNDPGYAYLSGHNGIHDLENSPYESATLAYGRKVGNAFRDVIRRGLQDKLVISTATPPTINDFAINGSSQLMELPIKYSPEKISFLTTTFLPQFLSTYYTKRLGEEVVQIIDDNSICLQVCKELSNDFWTFLQLRFFFPMAENGNIQLLMTTDGKWFRGNKPTLDLMLELGDEHEISTSRTYAPYASKYLKKVGRDFLSLLPKN